MHVSLDLPPQAIVALQPSEARTIHVYDSRDIYKLRTTSVPSHHCPGAVMFLFERLDDEVIVNYVYIIINLVSKHSMYHDLCLSVWSAANIQEFIK